MAFKNVCIFASLFVSTEDRKLSVAIAGRVWGAAVVRSSSMDILRHGGGQGGRGIIYPQHCEDTVKKNHCWEKRGGFRDDFQSRCANYGTTYLIIGTAVGCRECSTGWLTSVQREEECVNSACVTPKGSKFQVSPTPLRGKAALAA